VTVAADTLWTPAAAAVFQQIGFSPHPAQEPILACRKRFVLVTGGGQAGKSVVASKKFLINWLQDKERYQRCYYPQACEGHADGIRCDPTLLYWLVGADYAQCSEEWRYIQDDLFAMGLPVQSSNQIDSPGWITVQLPDERRPRLRIEVKTARDPTKIARAAPNGQIGCEAGQLEFQIYNRMRERASHRPGWLFLIGTIEKTQPWYPRMRRAWQHGQEDRQSFRLPTYSNTTRFPGGRNDPEILSLEAESPDDFFMERVEGLDVPPAGLVFPEVQDLHIRADAEYIPGDTVYICEDPGYGESVHAVELAHVVGGQVRVFDEIYERGLVTSQIIEICKGKAWWKIADKVLVADPYYKDAHHSMPSVAETWMKETGLVAHGTRTHVNEGIMRMKDFLKPHPLTKEPKIIFHPRCKGILAEAGLIPNRDDQLEPWRWRLDSNGEYIGKTPIDRHNDGFKAVIAFLVDMFGVSSSARTKIPVKRRLA
jgi:hypothetical protein